MIKHINLHSNSQNTQCMSTVRYTILETVTLQILVSHVAIYELGKYLNYPV